MRPMADKFAPGVFWTALLGYLTLGILPLVTLPRKLRSFAARERDQLFHFAQWMRQQFGSDADLLDPRTPALDQVVHVLRLVSWMCAAIAVGAIVWVIARGADPEMVWRLAYGQGRRPYYHSYHETFFMVWMPSLCVGYAAHWLAVRVHQTRVQRFVHNFNELARGRALSPATSPSEFLGFRPLWIIGAMLFLGNGIWWGIPLMVAGAAQSRYIRHGSRWIRQDLAQRVRDVLRATRPTMTLTVPVVLRRKCPVSMCQAPLPQTAAFCPRCGTRVAAVDRVA
jgi:hypothetical protein